MIWFIPLADERWVCR